MQVDLLSSQDIDPVEQRLCEHPPTRTFGLVPKPGEIAEVSDSLGSGGSTRSDALRVGFLLVKAAHRRLEGRRVPIAAIESEGRLAIALDPCERCRVDGRRIRTELGHHIHGELGIRADVR
jgi:hypothetical protein